MGGITLAVNCAGIATAGRTLGREGDGFKVAMSALDVHRGFGPAYVARSAKSPIDDAVRRITDRVTGVRVVWGGRWTHGQPGALIALRLPSGEVRMVHSRCYATIGEVGNSEHELVKIGKAGRNRWYGNRPKVRGVAMNPIDHPNGGRTNGGKHWATPWGKPTKGAKTRKNKATDKFIIRSRKAKKKR